MNRHILQHGVSGVEPWSGVMIWSVLKKKKNLIQSPLKSKDDLSMALDSHKDHLYFHG